MGVVVIVIVIVVVVMVLVVLVVAPVAAVRWCYPDPAGTFPAVVVDDASKPLVMIGPGTSIAPMRAILHAVATCGACGQASGGGEKGEKTTTTTTTTTTTGSTGYATAIGTSSSATSSWIWPTPRSRRRCLRVRAVGRLSRPRRPKSAPSLFRHPPRPRPRPRPRRRRCGCAWPSAGRARGRRGARRGGARGAAPRHRLREAPNAAAPGTRRPPRRRCLRAGAPGDARDVNAALKHAAMAHGQLSAPQAKEFLRKLERRRRLCVELVDSRKAW